MCNNKLNMSDQEDYEHRRREMKAGIVKDFETSVEEDEEIMALLSLAEKFKMTLVWEYKDAPYVFSNFNQGGDEEQVIFIPNDCGVRGEYLNRRHHCEHSYNTKYGEVIVTSH